MNFVFPLFLAMALAPMPSFAVTDDALMRAKSSLEFELAVVERDESASLGKKCESELRGSELPRACFKLIRSSNGDRVDWLERVCEKRARGAARVETLEETDGLPDRCRGFAKERLEDLRYRLEDEEPEKLLDDVRSSDSWSGS